MPAALFSFDGSTFHELTKKAGDYFAKKYIGRGAAACDFDLDGDWDIVVNHQNDKVSFLRNDSKSGHFVKLRMIGTESNRMGYGTQVTLHADGKQYFQELVAGTTYVSSNEPSLIFGLGEYEGKCKLEIRWPSGKKETIEDVVLDQSLVLVEKS